MAIYGGRTRRGNTAIDDRAKRSKKGGAPMTAENDVFISGFHGIPSPEKLRQMSFLELAELLSSCKNGSTKFLVVERELKIRIAEDQAKINRRNMLARNGVKSCISVHQCKT